MPMTWGTEEIEDNLRKTRERYARTRTERNLKSIAIVVAMMAAMALASQIGGLEPLAGGSTTGNPEIYELPVAEPQLSMPRLGRLSRDRDLKDRRTSRGPQ